MIEIQHKVTGTVLCRKAGSSLRGVSLQGVSLQGADVRGADLRGANLASVGTSFVDLDGAKLQGVRADETTRWPRFFEPAQRGCVMPTEVIPASSTSRGNEGTPARQQEGYLSRPSQPAV